MCVCVCVSCSFLLGYLRNQAGKALALNTEDGTVVWARMLDQFEQHTPPSGGSGSKHSAARSNKVVRVVRLRQNEVAVIIQQQQQQVSTHVLFLNPITGTPGSRKGEFCLCVS